MHLKPTAGCQIPTLIFESKLWRGVSMNIPYKICQGRYVLVHFGLRLKVLPGSLTDLSA
jgi:hydrogenase maturation factor